jgi:hypothetical protein
MHQLDVNYSRLSSLLISPACVLCETRVIADKFVALAEEIFDHFKLSIHLNKIENLLT